MVSRLCPDQRRHPGGSVHARPAHSKTPGDMDRRDRSQHEKKCTRELAVNDLKQPGYIASRDACWRYRREKLALRDRPRQPRARLPVADHERLSSAASFPRAARWLSVCPKGIISGLRLCDNTSSRSAHAERAETHWQRRQASGDRSAALRSLPRRDRRFRPRRPRPGGEPVQFHAARAIVDTRSGCDVVSRWRSSREGAKAEAS